MFVFLGEGYSIQKIKSMGNNIKSVPTFYLHKTETQIQLNLLDLIHLNLHLHKYTYSMNYNCSVYKLKS